MAIEDQLTVKLGQLAEVNIKAGDAIRLLNHVLGMLLEARMFDLTPDQRAQVQNRCLAAIEAVKTSAAAL